MFLEIRKPKNTIHRSNPMNKNPPKYSIEQWVWYMGRNSLVNGKISGIEIGENEILYSFTMKKTKYFNPNASLLLKH
jgi:hypothetical protein